MKNYEELKSVDIHTVDKSTLTDIKDIKINTNLPVHKRIEQFLSDVKNPYCIISNGMVVKLTYSESAETLNDRMKIYFNAKCGDSF